MRSAITPWLAVPVFLASALAAQTPPTTAPPAAAPKGPPPTLPATPPPKVEATVVTVEVRAQAPGLRPGETASPEAHALLGQLRDQAHLVSRMYLVQDVARQEIVSRDFVLPEGTVVLHRAGDRYYAIADPKAQTFLVMDADALLNALEGGIGIENSKYDAAVRHTQERRTIAGYAARKSNVIVTYASSIPFENERVLVQQKNEIEVWHTSDLVSAAALDHFFFKYQRDRSGTAQKAISQEIGFPMEIKMTVSLGGAGGRPPKAQPGSLHMVVTEVRKERMDADLFKVPPPGYRRIEKSPYFKERSPSG